jgi:hypothetical protein
MAASHRSRALSKSLQAEDFSANRADELLADSVARTPE